MVMEIWIYENFDRNVLFLLNKKKEKGKIRKFFIVKL